MRPLAPPGDGQHLAAVPGRVQWDRDSRVLTQDVQGGEALPLLRVREQLDSRLCERESQSDSRQSVLCEQDHRYPEALAPNAGHGLAVIDLGPKLRQDFAPVYQLAQLDRQLAPLGRLHWTANPRQPTAFERVRPPRVGGGAV